MGILLVEDEASIAEPIRRFLAHERYCVNWAPDLSAAFQVLEKEEPELVILDIMLPEGEEAGFEFASYLREAGYQGPILFFSARDTVDDRVRGLNLGGDDYLVKPFSLLELQARIRALLRREAQVKSASLERGPLSVDFNSREVRWDGQPVLLSDKELAMLELFALHPTRIFTREELLERLSPGSNSGTAIIRVYVHKLREKLGPEVIVTTPAGYQLGVV